MKNFVLTVLCIALAILICIACAVYGFGYRYINLPELELKYFGTVDKDLQPLRGTISYSVGSNGVLDA